MTKSKGSGANDYTVFEAAQMMRVNPTDLADMIFDGELKCVTNGGVPRILASEVTSFIELQPALERLTRRLIEKALRAGVMETVKSGKKGYPAFRFKPAVSRSRSRLRGGNI